MGVLRPSGPLPASVYWRRRAVVLAAAVLVVVLVVVVVRALLPSGEDPAAEPSPSLSADTDGTVLCADTDLDVQVTTDAADYPAGTNPVFTIELTNTGEQPCVVDAGDPERVVTVTSGSDRIWSSMDCAAAAPVRLLLAAGQSDQRQVSWDRTRSETGCTANLPAPRAGTYQAQVTVADVTSSPAIFTLG